MVVGFDVCHDTHNKASSYGALVASLDRHCTKYFSTVTPHNNGEELSHNLGLNVISKNNNNYDPNILFSFFLISFVYICLWFSSFQRLSGNIKRIIMPSLTKSLYTVMVWERDSCLTSLKQS